MYKALFFILALFVMSCTSNTSNMREETQQSQQPEYVMNDSLSTDYYIDMKGYIPVEGLVPTADVAVKIAECVLFEIYGKEKIEKEKPFSVNLRDGVWIIEGNIPDIKNGDITFCGQVYMEIKKSNGEILKLLHTK
ncbi:MAG: NTF2 fold immunity protein [Bacteroides sp.]|uniref:NTF2 fold immunity protein n=1 Tax=Bacteroides sp. TaxID=29523 RepID=UPI0026E07ACB|nr:NTF2 fold immunity protein [Bacteroides sp.]MDO5420797.1 NTF2 fold immunity protein [Bacteroides sp.]